jgi:outer membrane protein
LRAVDENITQARSGFLPTIAATGAGRLSNERSTTQDSVVSGLNGESRHGTYGVALRQPIFRGFRTQNAVSQAEAATRAGQETLRNVEQTVLLAAITAHMDVVVSRRLVQLAERSVRLLSEFLGQMERRFKENDVTLTDVELSRSRLAAAKVTLETARAAYKASRARFEEVAGIPALNLRYPPRPTRLLPVSLEAAVEAAGNESPVIGSAYFREVAAHFAVNTVGGELLPEVFLSGDYEHEDISGAGAGRTTTRDLEVRMNVPIFDGGLTRSRVRQAKELQFSLRQELEQFRNQVRQQVITAWSAAKANDAQVEGRKTQLRSVEIALKGLREEEALGQRTVANVLDALQEVVLAETALTGVERDRVVNAYALLASVGRLTIENLGLLDPRDIYEPEVHAENVRHDVWSTTITYGDGLPAGNSTRRR